MSRKLKPSIAIYRTFNGVRFEQVTSDPSLFEQLKKECKLAKKKFRILNGQFLKESIDLSKVQKIAGTTNKKKVAITAGTAILAFAQLDFTHDYTEVKKGSILIDRNGCLHRVTKVNKDKAGRKQIWEGEDCLAVQYHAPHNMLTKQPFYAHQFELDGEVMKQVLALAKIENTMEPVGGASMKDFTEKFLK